MIWLDYLIGKPATTCVFRCFFRIGEILHSPQTLVFGVDSESPARKGAGLAAGFLVPPRRRAGGFGVLGLT